MNFNWVVDAVAEMAIRKAQIPRGSAQDLRWSRFLAGGATR